MRYEVPNVPFFCQRQAMACWYACAMMLLCWRQGGNVCEPPPASDFPEIGAHLAADGGLLHAEMLGFTHRLGLQPIPRMRRLPTVIELQNWLRIFGPLWTDGIALDPRSGKSRRSNHVVVIGGVDDTTAQMLVLDPWPVDRGDRRWRPFAHLHAMLADRNHPARPVTFLHCPARLP
jgi:hypothetical protein